MIFSLRRTTLDIKEISVSCISQVVATRFDIQLQKNFGYISLFLIFPGYCRLTLDVVVCFLYFQNIVDSPRYIEYLVIDLLV